MRTWIVGGTSGIGAACSQVLRLAGHQVSSTGREVDVRRDDVVAAYAVAGDPFEAMIYSAGVNWLDWTQDLDSKEALRLYDINVLGLIRVLQATPTLKKVVVIGSDAAWRPMRTSLAYNASKAALHSAVQCIARERGSDSFSINVVAPGLVQQTEMTDYVYERTQEVRGWTPQSTEDYMITQIPLGRPADPVEVAFVVRDVLEWPPYVNGAIIPVNGAR